MDRRNRITTALRILSTDSINKANSGHPGICLGATSIMTSLLVDTLNITPECKDWINRDRFILSAGHGAPLLYSALHLAGYEISMDDMKNLRQLHSVTAGHPECDLVKGIDASTGPLGQGIAMGVGMAIAERYYEAYFNTEDIKLFDNYTYVLCGDGCLQEGVALEALSLCAHQKLDKVILLFDSNDIQLDGSTSLTISEDYKAKFEAMGFNYVLVSDGNSTEEIVAAINACKAQNEKPSIVEVRTVIGHGTTLAGSAACHGAPIGEENSNLIRSKFGWEYPPFEMPQSVYDDVKKAVDSLGGQKYKNWNLLLEEYKTKYPEKAQDLAKFMDNSFEPTIGLDYAEGYSEATRKSGGVSLDLFQNACPNLLGGSADLTKSTQAKGINGNNTKETPLGRNICYGVREHAMGAIANGITLYGGLRTFTGAFFVFSDYMKPAIRMAALMKVPTIFIFTHDSVMVGEDGPTHEPIEQLEGLRCIPNCNVIRPADARETYAAVKLAYESTETPTVIVLSRQNLTVTKTDAKKVSLGAYVVKDAETPDHILLATGSEVSLALEAAKLIEAEGLSVKVVSMPSEFLFEEQSEEYKESVLGCRCKTTAIEMGCSHGWYKYAKRVIGIDTFGLSAPAGVLAKHFGFTPEAIANKILNK